MAEEKEQKNSFPEEIPVPEGESLEAIGQQQGGSNPIVDLPTVLTTPAGDITFDLIEDQETCEGQDPWSFDVSGFLRSVPGVNPVSWDIYIQPVFVGPAGPDLRNVSISADGLIRATIPGERGNQAVSGADEIQEDYQYIVRVAADMGSGLGSVMHPFILNVKAAPDGEDATVGRTEDSRGNRSNIANYFTNNPTEFHVLQQPVVQRALKAIPSTTGIQGAELVPDQSMLARAPNLNIEIDDNGYATYTPDPIPNINARYEYKAKIRGQNDCGWDDIDFSIFLFENPADLDHVRMNQTVLNFTEENSASNPPQPTFDPSPYVGEKKPSGFFLDSESADFFRLLREGGVNDYSGTVEHNVFGVDPPSYVPQVTINQDTGLLTLLNTPKVLGPSSNSHYPHAQVQVSMAPMNTTGGVSYFIIFNIEAVPPRWSGTPFIYTIEEKTTGRFTFNHTTEIENYEFSNSSTDQVRFSLVNSPGWCTIDQNTGTVTVKAPEVVGNLVFNPSDTYTARIRAENEKDHADKVLTIVVSNSDDVPILPPVKIRDTTDPPFIDDRGDPPPDPDEDPDDDIPTLPPVCVTCPRDRNGDPGDDDDEEEDPPIIVQNCIPSQSVDEEESISINVLQYVSQTFIDAVSSYTFALTGISALTPGAPNLVLGRDLTIGGTSGVISGTAPAVNDRHHTYSVTVSIMATVTPMDGPESSATWLCAFALNVRQKAPESTAITIDPFDEFSNIAFPLGNFYSNDPTEYDIGTGTSLTQPGPGEDPSPPPPVLSADSAGNVTAQEAAPDVERVESYSYPITARNTINYPTRAERDANKQEDPSNFILTIQEVVPRWRTIQPQIITEGGGILISLGAFVDNDPDTFSLVSVTAITSGAATLNLRVESGTGLLTGDAQYVTQDTSYTVVARCRNSAGVADPDGTFMLIVKNLKPRFTGTTTFEMNEGSTKSFDAAAFIDPNTEVTDYSVSPPELTSTHDPEPTMTTSMNMPSARGIFSATVSQVAGDSNAFFTVPVIATNSAGSTVQNFYIRVINSTDNPIFSLCEDQTFNEDTTESFNIKADHELVPRYSKRSGANWITIDAGTGTVTVNTPEVTGSIADNPSDSFDPTFRATVTNADGDTFTADCTLTITVLNVDEPPPDTPASWENLEDKSVIERSLISFNIGIFARGNPTPVLSLREDVINEDYLRISATGQVTGNAPEVGSTSAVATIDGRIWRLTLSTPASLSLTDFSFRSGVLDDDQTLEELVRIPGIRTLYFLRFSSPLDTLLPQNFTIVGANADSLSRAWYNRDTVYVRATNTVDGEEETADDSFFLYLINTDTGEPDTPPMLDVPDQEHTVGTPWALNLQDFTSGTKPYTYERTIIGDGPQRYSLPDFTERMGTGMTLTSAGLLAANPPSDITESEDHTIFVTARNRVSFDDDIFTLTLLPMEDPDAPYQRPNWTLGDLSRNEGVEIVPINPIADGTLTGTLPMVISLADGMNFPLPPGLILSNNVISGTPDSVDQDTPYTVKLRATNTNPDTNMAVSVDHEFVFTINNVPEPVDPDCVSPQILGIRIQRLRTGVTGTIDIRDRIRGGTPEIPPQVYADPEFSNLPFITSTSFGTGLIPYSIPADRDDYRDLLGFHDMYIEASACGETDKSQFSIAITQSITNPPVFGTCPDISMNMSTGYDEQTGTYDNPSTYNTNMYQHLTSMHSIERPTFEKDVTGIEDTWQTEDWWEISESGDLSITAPSVIRTETQALTIRATNPDGTDTCSFNLTINYIPQPPQFREIGVIEVNERARINFTLDPFIRFTYTNLRIDSVVAVRSDAPQLFIRSFEPPELPIGTIVGSDNANQSAVGTSCLLAAGSDPTVNTESAPQVDRDQDYTVTVTAINTGLVTRPEYPNNSDQTTFTLRVKDVFIMDPPPAWVSIPPQLTISGDSISLPVGQYARNSPTSYEIRSTTHSSGENPGAIILEANNAGIVTRLGGAVAPEVDRIATYTVIIRAINASGFSDCPFDWNIVPGETPPPGAPAFYSGGPIQGGYRFGEWNVTTGRTINAVSIATTTNYGLQSYIEGVGASIYILGTNRLGTISYNGTGGSITDLGTLTPSTITEFKGITSIGTTLYSFGRNASGWRLYSIDPSTRAATAVNTGAGANNFGLNNPQPGGLTSIGTTIYAVINTGPSLGVATFVSIPVSGPTATRGIATTINSDIASTLRSFADEGFIQRWGIETFGSIIQASMNLGNVALGRPGPIQRERIFNINRTTGTLTRVSGTSITGLTQYAISKPSCRLIPPQLVTEGQLINIPIASHFTNANSYSIGPLTSITSGNPVLNIQMDLASGTITGTTGNVNAPLVTNDSYYTAFVYGINTAGRTPCLLTIGILNGAPIWGAIPEQPVNEGDRISISLLPFVQNQPTHFRVGAITKENDTAPNLELQMNNRGQIFGVGSTVNAPQVTQNERYTITVGAENTAGLRWTNMTLVVRNVEGIGQRVPFVLRWDVPDEAQDESFDILVDFNIPVHSIRPESFQLDGIVLRGTPFLSWSPIPNDDIPANRPTAAQRNFDYLNTPVPVSGTKYYKLSFPRNILPEVIERDQLLNIYLIANQAQGALVS